MLHCASAFMDVPCYCSLDYIRPSVSVFDSLSQFLWPSFYLSLPFLLYSSTYHCLPLLLRLYCIFSAVLSVFTFLTAIRSDICLYYVSASQTHFICFLLLTFTLSPHFLPFYPPPLLSLFSKQITSRRHMVARWRSRER